MSVPPKYLSAAVLLLAVVFITGCSDKYAAERVSAQFADLRRRVEQQEAAIAKLAASAQVDRDEIARLSDQLNRLVRESDGDESATRLATETLRRDLASLRNDRERDIRQLEMLRSEVSTKAESRKVTLLSMELEDLKYERSRR